MRSPEPIFLAILAALLLLGPGCQTSSPRVLSLELEATEKDVLLCNVEIAAPRNPEDYLEWARGRMEQLDHEPANPFFADTPVYEFFYSFHSAGEVLATVHYRADEGAMLRHVSTRVYHDPLGEEATR